VTALVRRPLIHRCTSADFLTENRIPTRTVPALPSSITLKGSNPSHHALSGFQARKYLFFFASGSSRNFSHLLPLALVPSRYHRRSHSSPVSLQVVMIEIKQNFPVPFYLSVEKAIKWLSEPLIWLWEQRTLPKKADSRLFGSSSIDHSDKPLDRLKRNLPFP
jgi:hypothetical protein